VERASETAKYVFPVPAGPMQNTRSLLLMALTYLACPSVLGVTGCPFINTSIDRSGIELSIPLSMSAITITMSSSSSLPVLLMIYNRL
jgi:hypothetical protein